MRNEKIYKITVCAMMIAVGLVLPFVTGQVPEIGNMLLPMHLPIMMCGLVLGGPWGAAAGLITPIFRSLIFSRPVMYPAALAMAPELAVYGLVIGLIYSASRKQNLASIYVALVSAMIAGRLVWGFAMACLMGFSKFTISYFLTEAVVNAIPGILLQLVIIPALMMILKRARIGKNL